MLSPLWTLIALGLYVGLLFFIAAQGDRQAKEAPFEGRRRALIYTLGLGVYCTSWTFFGAVGETARNGWDYLPIYLGPALLFLIGYPIVRRIVRVGREQDTASIADFLAARFGKSTGVAAIAAGILVLAALPYIALQLRSAEAALEVITDIPDGIDLALLSGVAFAAFSILFGARTPDSSTSNPGLALAISVEALVKLMAMLAIGSLALVLIWRGEVPLPETLPLNHQPIDFRFLILTLLAALAALCLPRQFHMMVVENRKTEDIAAARFGFPVYLFLVAVAAPPIALAGTSLLPLENPDNYILALPVSMEAGGLALLAFLGGFSAAIGMVTITTLALSTMIVNDWLGPVVLRGAPELTQGLAKRLLTWRRIAILFLILAAYLFHRSFAGPSGLASIGLISFAGAAQLAPPLLFGLFWRRANRFGAMTGLIVGAACWFGLVLFPAYSGQPVLPDIGLDAFSVAAGLSLFLNGLSTVLVSAFTSSGLVDRLQAEAFTRPARQVANDAAHISGARIADIETLFGRVLGVDMASVALEEVSRQIGRPLQSNDPVTLAIASYSEARIARAIGSASARLLMTRVVKGAVIAPDEVITLIDETAEKIRSSENALAETERSTRFYTDHIPALLSYADRDYRLVFANQPYLDFFDLNRDSLGRSMGEYMSEGELAARWPYMEAALAGQRQEFDITRKDSRGRARIWQLVYQPRIENGDVLGFYGVYQDVTARREAEEGLKRAYETLEEKVTERTQELEAARALAEAATHSKTRFLAAASHDLLQPLSAARLLASSLEQDLESAPQETRELAQRIDRAIENADQLLRALLDISRLDAGGVQPDITHFALQPLLEDLIQQFRVKASAKNVELVLVPTSLSVKTDRGLLTSLIQNLISNAVRYTDQGRVVVGVRRRGGTIALQIHDTGPGMDDSLRSRIFTEFERGPRKEGGDRGLGLGLAIVDRIARQLDLPLKLWTEPGKGSCFELSLQRATSLPVRTTGPRRSTASLEGLYILYVDNEPDMLAAGLGLLQRWGCHAVGAATEADAKASQFSTKGPDILILDYHLDEGVLGPQVYKALSDYYGRRIPGILVTADRGPDPEVAAADLGLQLLRKPLAPASLRATLAALKRKLR